MNKYPSIHNFVKSNNISSVNYFFDNINTTTWTIQRIDVLISGLISYGGTPENILYFIINDRIQSYASLLMNGVKDEDAHYYNYESNYFVFGIIPMDVILTFRALVPIVGYYYAHNFILNRRYNLDNYPFFLEIASQMNSRNYFCIDKCVSFSKTGGSIDKLFTLRNRKRHSEE